VVKAVVDALAVRVWIPISQVLIYDYNELSTIFIKEKMKKMME